MPMITPMVTTITMEPGIIMRRSTTMTIIMDTTIMASIISTMVTRSRLVKQWGSPGRW